jgi:hypothetical protein
MNDRCLFLQDEITIAFVDDFFVLPFKPILGNIYQGLNEATERHDLMFQYVH